jgi:ABC-type branched-subunit amino acid transport system permease subunit
LIASRFGKVLTAIRDNENRVLALGYHTGRYKTFLFAFAGLLAGLSGALYVLANFPVCDTTYLSVPFSIEAVVWVAIGGRGTLLGAVVGALLVGFGQAYITSALPDQWLIVLGGLFVAVVLFMPRGLTPVAGPTALIGLLCGVLLVIYLENSRLPGMSETLLSYVDQKVGYRRAGRIFVGCPVMLLMVLVPAAVTAVVRKIGRLAWRVIGKPTPALEPSVP